jgi:hypothetical protein
MPRRRAYRCRQGQAVSRLEKPFDKGLEPRAGQAEAGFSGGIEQIGRAVG